MANSIYHELHGLVDRLEDAAEKYPDFRLCIITGSVLTADGQMPGKPALFDPFGLSADDESRQRRAGELLDLLASDAVALLTRAGVDIGNEDSFEPTRLVYWAAENIPAFNKKPHWGEGRGTTAKPSESPGDNEVLEPKADIFTVVALAVRRLAAADPPPAEFVPCDVAADLIRKEAGANQPIGEQSEPCAVHRDDEAEATKPTGGKPKQAATVNCRMAGTIMENPEAMGWNSTQWAKHLKCGKSSVVETATWKKLESARLQAKAERMKDRRRKPKASDRRHD
jgi:hypothetical protein